MKLTTADRIIAAAETRIRTGGYNSFSFRDIAKDTGLTNAGVHHYFPAKADLAARVAQDYTARFVAALDDTPPKARVAKLRDLFSESVRQDGRMCLCGLLASESGGLPDPVAEAARGFFTELAVRLEPAFPDAEDSHTEALRILALLEGAVLVAFSLSDAQLFGRLTASLT
ncbi:MAG: TetR/AcrR family transcriptional regulator [Pseudomonadota bacterium]